MTNCIKEIHPTGFCKYCDPGMNQVERISNPATTAGWQMIDGKSRIYEWRCLRCGVCYPESSLFTIQQVNERMQKLGRLPTRPKIVCLCGSTRFYEMFQSANYEETMSGHIVLSVGFYPHNSAVHGEDVGCSQRDRHGSKTMADKPLDLDAMAKRARYHLSNHDGDARALADEVLHLIARVRELEAELKKHKWRSYNSTNLEAPDATR